MLCSILHALRTVDPKTIRLLTQTSLSGVSQLTLVFINDDVPGAVKRPDLPYEDGQPESQKTVVVHTLT